jgi:hypothetical protein
VTRCDVCGADATMLVTSRDNGNHYGSFNSYRCGPHGRDAIQAHKDAGLPVQALPLGEPTHDENDAMGEETTAPDHKEAA